ncbi:hypothetical protein COU37_05415 [Candidatus Micrarchaeota archaeon CG10_big_fil_rev_8_21_14_0_10_45_29]|nr:MAG: hypothetical protein COU37_05415 [Candidatus Micrarchaeota archaeon CG10_big_fil_rev_8_21_14_0_10_45_29]
MDILGLNEKALKKGHKRTSPDTAELCPACKKNARIYCPHKPILAIKAEMAKEFDKQNFFGPSPPNLFVGHFGYPSVNWGPMINLDDSLPDNPREWYGWDFDKIVRARSMQIRGQANAKVMQAQKSPGFARQGRENRMLIDSQEAAMSCKKVDIEAHFSKKPSLNVSFHSIHQPMGPSAPLEKLSLAENPKIPKKVDSLVNEGVRASFAIKELSAAGYDENYLCRLLTCGVLGKKDARRLVPTKWGITATDDMVAKEHIEKIRNFSQANEFLLYFNEYLANRFWILLMPGAWEYENFEGWMGAGGNYALNREYEPFFGRSEYAFKQGGGYYAARLGVCEALASSLRRQARVVVIREILPEYDLPVGVWEIRENVRHAMKNTPLKFSSKEEILSYLQKNLKLPSSAIFSQSAILRQSRLAEF